VCRVYRAEVVAQHGSWAQAEQEARKACEELQRYQISEIAALGFYAVGQIRLRMGDLPAADAAFDMRMSSAPSRTWSRLVRLAEGDALAAGASLRRALANESERFRASPTPSC